jgi:hypothetical protein
MLDGSLLNHDRPRGPPEPIGRVRCECLADRVKSLAWPRRTVARMAVDLAELMAEDRARDELAFARN